MLQNSYKKHGTRAKQLKHDPGVYLNDFEEIKIILEGTDVKEKVDEWLDELPCHLYTF